ncbi:MAG: AgmX/PglI C-terminal domain-containing protein [Oligoflexales bacterium]|nr:AgmX/PglI C-terminal domain-containing protein [Oligoflexales bacterium]
MALLNKVSKLAIPISLLLFLQATYATSANIFPWQGEYFGKKEGGFYLYLEPQGLGSKLSVNTKVSLIFYNPLNKRRFKLTESLEKFEPGNPPSIWKIPSGKYFIVAIEVTTGSARLIWKTNPQKRRTLVVKRISISNFGNWKISLKNKNSLDVQFRMSKNTYQSDNQSDESAVAVFNGFNGNIQKVLGGKQLIERAKNNYEKADELRVQTRMVRTISLKWTLDLLKDNNRAHAVNQIIVAHDPYFRKCYKNRLDDTGNLRGKIIYGFILVKSSGTMSKIRHIGGTLNDIQLVNCIQKELKDMRFSIGRNMVGKLAFDFNAF